MEVNKTSQFALIVDGISLTYVTESDFIKDFLKICLKCEAVLCCRMSPFQKAQVFKFFKSNRLIVVYHSRFRLSIFDCIKFKLSIIL